MGQQSPVTYILQVSGNLFEAWTPFIQNIFPQLVFLRGWMMEWCKICNLQWPREITALQLKKTHAKGENAGYLWKQLHQFDNQCTTFRKHGAQQNRVQKGCQHWKVVPVDTSAKTLWHACCYVCKSGSLWSRVHVASGYIRLHHQVVDWHAALLYTAVESGCYNIHPISITSIKSFS